MNHFPQMLLALLSYLNFSTTVIANLNHNGKPNAVMACNIGSVSSAIHNQKFSLPATVYHFGRRKILEKDIQAKTVPLEDWANFIVGENTRSGHQPERRGLYVSDGIDTNGWGQELSSMTFGNNWLMEVHISEDCRSKQRIASLMDIQEDGRFVEWFNDHLKRGTIMGATAVEFGEYCSANLSLFGYSDDRCSEIVQVFLHDLNIGIVQDDNLLKSYYIRDRSCIRDIKGSPEDLVSILTQTKLSKSNCQIDLGPAYFPYYLVQALGSEQVLEPEIFQKISDNVVLVKRTKVRLEMQKMLRNYAACKTIGTLPEFKKHLSNLHLASGEGLNFFWNPLVCTQVTGNSSQL